MWQNRRMIESARRPTGAAIAAAVSPFIGGPLTVLFLLRCVGLGEDEFGGGPFGNLSAAWVEGGAAMSLVAVAAGAVSLIAAVLMFFGVQRGSPAVLVNAPLASGLVACGTLGFWTGMKAGLEAIAGALPADGATILAGSLRETLNPSLFGLCAMGGLLGALCPGLLLGVIAQTGQARRVLVVAMGVFGSLMLMAWALAQRLSELMSSLRPVVHTGPVDRLAILVGVGEELSRYRVYAISALVMLLAVVMAGALMLKASPKRAIAVPLLSLAGLFGFGTQELADLRIQSLAARVVTPTKPLGLVELNGYSSIEPRWCVNEKELVDCDAEGLKSPVEHDVLVDELSAGARFGDEDDAEPRVGLGLVRGASAETTWRFFNTAVQAGVHRVALVGETAPRVVKLPSEIGPLGKALDSRFRRVSVGLAKASTGCSKGCRPATVEGTSLVVDGQKWVATPLEGWSKRLDEQVAITATAEVTPETLVALAMAAVANQRRLVVLLPDGDFTRVEPEDDSAAVLEGDPAPPPAGLTTEQISAVIESHLGEMKQCNKRELKGKSVLRFRIEPDGSVKEVEIDSSTFEDSNVSRCLAARPATWKFPRPSDGEPIEVVFPFAFPLPK